MKERVLAVCGQITDILPIEGADFIVQAKVFCGSEGRWSGVVPKEAKVGEKVIVFLQDALLPPDSRWSFMESRHWRVSMARFKGVPSECLIIPGSEADNVEVGTNLTEVLGVRKYEKPISEAMMGEALGSFPSFIPQTDETNFQASEDVHKMTLEAYYITEKADGTSCTAWVDDDGQLHVCSRNLELRELSESGKSNIYWRAARKYSLENLPKDIALQFEVVGPNIQKNRMGLTGLEIRVFLAWDIQERKYLSYQNLKVICRNLGLPMAKCLGKFEPSDEEPDADRLQNMAEIRYENGKVGEGIVIRNMSSTWSFKVINLLYKD